MGTTCTKPSRTAVLVPYYTVASAVTRKIVELPPDTRVGKENHLPNLPNRFTRTRRGSVSAEVILHGKGRVPPVSHHDQGGTMDAESEILNAMKHSFLFNDMDEHQRREVVVAMRKVTTVSGQIIIKEGEEGDNFYVIQEGDFSALKGDACVFTYKGKGCFGELALMYNCPRAATVRADTAGVLWSMDRVTFRDIVLASRIDRRQLYEEILDKMEVLSALTPENRAAVADCLQPEEVQDGEFILREGERLTAESKFYLIESGTVECSKTFQDEKRVTAVLKPGEFFGEVALITHGSYRAADCVARGTTKLLTLGRDAFERLMGPAEDILEEKVDEYIKLNLRVGAAVDELAHIDEDAPAAGLKRVRGYSLI